MTEMTGRAAMRLIEGMTLAIDVAGAGEMRGMKALAKLNALGLDLIAIEMPPPEQKPVALGEGG